MDFMPDYNQDEELVKQFLREFTEEPNTLKYGPELNKLANRISTHMFVDLADVAKFNNDLASRIVNNTGRYSKIFHEALDQVLPAFKSGEPQNRDPMDVFIEQRSLIHGDYPPELLRRAEIFFKPETFEATPIRQVKAENLGKFVTVRGIVTRTTDVKPQITIATYTCDQCGCETFQPISGDFTPLYDCTSPPCKSNKTIGRITLQTRGSKFIKAQEVKLQEHSDQVPTGNIPRTITVILHGELTRSCAPGDHISVSGVFLPLQTKGFRAMSGGLITDTFIEAHYVTQMNKTEDDELNVDAMSPEEAEQLIRGEDNFLSKLSSSIAPEIYGHEELKKALLLLLVGGVDKSPHGMRIRGNINICLMGDPGVAKSQMLSFIDRLASRSQYTTGRGSSGVGLTAAVLKDPITNELVLEGGALVLADQGICCIDEFDKMMDADRTAIHEVMEQQTVSIAKAGIMTTLNARVSILAAANPAYGRYNTSRSMSDNLELPPALLSRFDLLWLIRDIPEIGKDLNLAQHVTHIHTHPDEEAPNQFNSIDMRVMRRYINLCKQKNPIIPRDLSPKLVQIYLDIRAKKRTNPAEESLFTSPRSLLAILRLTTAFARLRLADVVEEADIKAAVKLYSCSRESIEGGSLTEASSMIREIKKIMENMDQPLDIYDVYNEAAGFNYGKDDVDQALARLEQMDSISINKDKIVLL